MLNKDSTTLRDSYGRVQGYLRISITDRCDLGCFYCRPSAGFNLRKESEILSDRELLRLARVFAGLGVDKVRLTGGEPLLRPGVESLVRELKALPGLRTVGLTTNGVRLAGLAGALCAAGLDMVNISLDSLDPIRFLRITAGRVHHRVLRGLRLALDTGFSSVKVNVVVIRGVNDDELERFTALAADNPLTVRFIEYMPFSSNPWHESRFVSSREMRERIEASYNLELLGEESPGQVSRDWRIEGGKGRVGFISALSEHFCGSCNRLRLTADGMLKLCLYSGPVLDLRRPLRDGASDLELGALIRGVMPQKPSAHPPVEELLTAEKQVMTEIGG